jgi:uncharacterized protein YbjT (DUF2867 family)
MCALPLTGDETPQIELPLSMKSNRVFVLGGTGFVGQHLLNRLSRAGIPCRVPTRRPHRHRDLRLVPGCELYEISGWGCDALAEGMAGCGAVINLVGILNESRGRTFTASHVTLVEQATRAAVQAGVSRYLHMCALNANADTGPSDYLRTKGQGEAVALAAAADGLAATSFRPSVIFGPGDSFFNRFARLLKWLPGPFPLACADARFAPVYVGDVVEAILHVLECPGSQGRTYELCGPQVFTLRDLVVYTGEQIGRQVRVISLDDRLAQLQARVFQRLPGKPFTMDNYRSLQIDSICTRDGFAELGLIATGIDVVVPAYLR